MKLMNWSAGFALFATLLLCSPRRVDADTKSPAPGHNEAGDPDAEAQHCLEWNLRTLVDDYDRYGNRDPKWDESVKVALTAVAWSRAGLDSGRRKDASADIPIATKIALANGCDDPLVRYLNARYVMRSEKRSPGETAQAYRAAAEGLIRSRYSPIRKFYATLRMAEALNIGDRVPVEIDDWREKASHYLTEAVADQTMPVSEVYDACHALLTEVENNVSQHERFYQAIEPIIFKNWPADASLYLLKGAFYTQYAWHARGYQFADKVTDDGWRRFADRLAEAEKALGKAWELNPRDERIAKEMITVELGQGKGRARMELWFKRATDLNPKYYPAFDSKRNYLEPKWHGSPEEMLKFGRECVNSQKWSGNVPLILLDVHEALAEYLPKDKRADYWKQPEVWKDLKAAFEKFFALNPQATGWRHNYALCAYRAEQWDDLNRLIPMLGPINYEFFGGKAQYDKMVRLAREHAEKVEKSSRAPALSEPKLRPGQRQDGAIG